MQILIFGMHRSGTSMVARLINMMGAYLGPEGSLLPAKEDNPTGFWERRDVITLNDALLSNNNCSWDKLAHWPQTSPLPPPPEAVIAKLRYLIMGMDTFRPWALKDPRLCLTFPYWRTLLEMPIVVIVHRGPTETSISLQKRNGFPLEYGVALWEHYAVNTLNVTQGLPRILIRYPDIHQRPVRACEYLYEQLVKLGVRGLSMPSQTEINAFIDPRLYRSKAPANPEYTLTDTQRILAEMMRGTRPAEENLIVSETSREVMKRAAAAA